MRLRDQRYVTLSQTSQQILGPNSRRKAVIITAPPALTDEGAYAGTLTPAVDTSTTGVKSSYTVPAGLQGIVIGATFQETTGTGVVAALQVVRAATTYNLIRSSTSGQYGGFPLIAGDVVQWNVITAQPASVSDFTISVSQDQTLQSVTISFTAPAVSGQGITLNPGTDPLILDSDQLQDALQDPIYAIAAAGSPVIGVLDLFGP